MTYTNYLEICCFQSISETYYSIYLVDTSGTNIAVYRKAEQSSTLRPAFTADKAVDGDENTNMNSALLSKTCTHTVKESYPWWQLDLGAREVIQKVCN